MEGKIEGKYKIFLTNGFQYTGIILTQGEKFITFQDYKDGKIRTVPLTSISIMEEVSK